jgi:SAM-dependent methyltransferase
MVASPGWGAAALAAFVAQPYLATAGTPLCPPAPAPVALLRRLLAPFALLRTTPTAAGSSLDPIESRRAGYTEELAGGIDRFFEPRRTTCPWCGGVALDEFLRTPDLVQFKPGEFVVEECQSCGLLFQNPRLSIAGLDFYYRDVYDGLGESGIQFLFAQSEPSYRGRVALARRHATPETWLDVGTGYGHFCLIARGILPGTRFDGLDMGTSIDEAQQRGWVDHAYRGLFPELVDEMAGRYDVVSMHHYLEHTRDPRAELDAARVALKPGGHLLIEVPDPESRFGRLFGKYWVPWLQPQHQQFLSVAHVSAALEAQGFTVVEIERGPAHQPVDIGGAIGMWTLATAPPSRLPWRDPPTTADKVKRAAVLGAMAPVAVAGVVADRALQPFIRRRGAGWASAYRILARRL